MNLVSKLNNRIDVYGKILYENELGEKDYTYGKIKPVWAEITPSGGSIRNGEANTIYSDISHKIPMLLTIYLMICILYLRIRDMILSILILIINIGIE